MAIVRLIYAALIVASGLFFILYLDPLSLILFLVIAVLPLFLFIITLIARFSIKINVKAKKTAAIKGEEAVLDFIINNRSFISLSNLKVVLKISNCFLGESKEHEVYFNAPALTTQTVHYAVTSKHIGKVTVKVKSAVIYDYFKLFTFKIKLNQDYEVAFLPEILPTPVNLRVNSYINTESEVFSKQKGGDDPSEIFKIRDYIGGDKLNRIHWKLTTKTGNLMVKEFSLPINTSIMIALELNADKTREGFLDYLDTVIEAAVCLSSYLSENNVRHYISWFDGKTNTVFKEDIKNKDDLYTTLSFILASQSYDTCATLESIKNSNIEYSHIVYITPNFNGSHGEIIRNMGSLSYITIAQALLKNDTAAIAPKGAQLLPISCGSVAESICEAVL